MRVKYLISFSAAAGSVNFDIQTLQSAVFITGVNVFVERTTLQVE